MSDDGFSLLYKFIAPDIVRVVLVVQAVILGAGGIMGFVKAQSKPSLIAGLSSAVMLFACTGLTFLNFTLAAVLSAIISDLLAAVFASRMSKTKKFMPSGILMLFCILAGIYYILVFVTPMIHVHGAQSKSPDSMPQAAPTSGGGGVRIPEELY